VSVRRSRDFKSMVVITFTASFSSGVVLDVKEVVVHVQRTFRVKQASGNLGFACW